MTDPNPEIRSMAEFDRLFRASLRAAALPEGQTPWNGIVRINPMTWERLLSEAQAPHVIEHMVAAGNMGFWCTMPVGPMEGTGVALCLTQ